jgi:hypothetical protein
MPPLGFLFDGLLPIFILPYSVSGVACQKSIRVNINFRFRFAIYSRPISSTKYFS